MDISPLAPTATPGVPSTPAPAPSNAVLSSDFETFLQMLTAQAR